ncbi:MAG: hypothetical protein HUU15_16130, partial [Candidatus Brocadiae bacterium]|nr:hypothetical protein [Candidatus Brocadiia bacterium]
RPEIVAPLVGDGDWSPAASAVDPVAAAEGAPSAATSAARLADYRRQAESWVGRDGCPEPDRSLVRGYFDRVVPGPR